ncbi:hypothetical protein BJ994_000061 [Arthrobacter pigmenti]|uniref:Carbohydrate kinase PfkB domain-containing protein n=1 Tax=Arthrobacter pigmenti TaxID=271432 RepID=A0A846RMD1_9MICC|nr:hexose kinase [Arthrobacter pigmenti]NJC20985.1 hypothetical protein [Arthrobacter pigmenti]
MNGADNLRGPVVTVTPNPAVDLTYAVNGISAGGSHRVSRPLSRAGGKGINVARVIHQAGHSTLAITTVGGGSGTEFAAELDGSGVPHRLVPVDGPTRRSMAFVDSADGETSIFNEQGAPLTDPEWSELRAAVEEALPAAGCLIGSGSLPEGAPEDFYPWLAARAASYAVPCIIDTSGSAVLAAADAGADVLKPNNHELLEATGVTDISTAAGMLLDRGVKLLFVSCGADGLRLYTAEDRRTMWHAKLPERLAGNPTGAGDAAVAAIAVLLAANITDPEAMLRYATSWSAAAVLMPAAGEIHPSHPQLAGQVEISRISLADVSSQEETEHVT